MKRREYLKRGEPIKTIVEEYRDFDDFINTVNSRDVVFIDGSVQTRERTDSYFTGVENYNEAVDLLAHGYSANIERMVKTVKSNTRNGQRVKTERYADVMGYAPIVPNAILGVPCSMMNQRKKTVKARVIEIVFNRNCAAHHSTTEIEEYCCKVVGMIMELERKGYRVKLSAAFSVQDTSKKRQYIMTIPVKGESQPLNIKRMSFALTHPAFQRCLCFDWCERLPKVVKVGGLGIAIEYCDEIYHRNLENHIGKNVVMLYHGKDLDEAFKDYLR